MTLNLSQLENSTDPQPEPSVSAVQRALRSLGFDVGAHGVDGRFGDRTEEAVKRFQQRAGLIVDGVVGRRTWAALSTSTEHKVTTAEAMAVKALALVTGRHRPQYVFGAEARLSDPYPPRLDCSELVQWAVYQVTGKVWVDGSFNQVRACEPMSVRAAEQTPGALLFRQDRGRVHHVAISMGDGTTAEARNSRVGCGSWKVGDRFNLAGRIPILSYS